MGRVVLGVLPLLAMSACSGDSESDGTREAPAAGVSASGETFVGRVAETMDAGGYTYVHLERAGESIWAAGPRGKVDVGEELGVSLAMPMRDFSSEALDRTFDVVYFVSAFERGGRSALQGMTEAMGDAHSRAPSTELDLGGIVKPDGGHTVAELWRGRSELAGQPVTLRGRVVKYNAGIMGRNWIHIQDGSGDPASGNHDVAVTSSGEASVGDLVLVRGTVAIDRDFGGGYHYGVLVEEASVTRE
jgi:hypothetical protein